MSAPERIWIHSPSMESGMWHDTSHEGYTVNIEYVRADLADCPKIRVGYADLISDLNDICLEFGCLGGEVRNEFIRRSLSELKAIKSTIHHGYDADGQKFYAAGQVIYLIPVSKFPDEILRMAERLRAVQLPADQRMAGEVCECGMSGPCMWDKCKSRFIRRAGKGE